jgi:glutamate-ammonia-ligase adenylyltransferase
MAGGHTAEEVLRLLGEVSEAIPRYLSRHPDIVEQVAAGERFDRQQLVAEARREAELAADLAEGGEAAIRRALRRIKYRVVGALVLEDLAGGPEAVDRITAVISDLADSLCEGALHFVDLRLAAAHGRPDWDGVGFVVLAMGKHGGRELNYSSDIDLIYLSQHQEGQTAGPRPISAGQYAERLGRGMGAILADRTEDGFCFRVDLALRPDGASGPLVLSLASAEHYYLSWGRTWERAAWLKARPCAGDIALGEELLERLEPFRYRRYLDFAMLEDIGSMRDRIAAAARSGTLAADLKRGPGGIRELEFLVQAGQLVWAGRHPALRVPGTVEALRLLEQHRCLPEGITAERMTHCYRVLRAVEHRLQWPQEAQTQKLPADDNPAAWSALARAMAGGSEAAVEPFRAQLQAVRDEVEAAWSALIGSSGRNTGSGDLVDPFASDEERRESLEALGFSDPEDASRRLAHLARLGGARRLSEGAWRSFERVAPELLSLAASSADPDAALRRLEAFISRAGARGTTYKLLYENPPVMATLVRLFADSAFLSELFIAHPELLDALVLRGQGGELLPRAAAALSEELLAELELLRDGDDALSILRTFHTVELLRIGLSDLGGSLAAPALANPWLTALAVACIRGAERIASRSMSLRHGPLLADDGEACPLGVVGMGSLGSGWMTYGSDVDMVFVYGQGGGAATSAGERPLDARVWTSRWSQRLISALTVPTREGSCYSVDMRLRPHGQAGLVVVPLDGFVSYYQHKARLWERIAMCRAATVAASDEQYSERIDQALIGARRAVSADPAALVAEAREMRRRQRTQLLTESAASYDLKLGAGGLADVEFVAACAAASRPEGHPSLALSDPVAALETLAEDGLLTREELQALAGGYTFLRGAESHLRLRSGRGVDRLEFAAPDAARVANALDFASVAQFRERLDEHRAAISSAGNAIMDRVASGA